MGKAHKQQHYVPKFYLQRFASAPGGKKVWALDKVAMRIREEGIRNVAGQAEFYGPADAPDSLEKMLCSREGIYQQAISRLVEASNRGSLSDTTRHEVAEFTAAQYVRTPEVRFNLADLMTEAYKATTGNEVGLTPAQEEKVLREPIREQQASWLREDLPEFTQAFLDLSWTLVENDTELAFWCSDNPIGRHNNLSDDSLKLLGPRAPGVQVYVPLDPKHCLMMYDSKNYPVKGPFIRCSDVSFVGYANVVQFMYSTRYVFSNVSYFADCLEVLRGQDPRVDPNRHRISARFYTDPEEPLLGRYRQGYLVTRDNLRPKGKPSEFSTIEDLEDEDRTDS